MRYLLKKCTTALWILLLTIFSKKRFLHSYRSLGTVYIFCENLLCFKQHTKCWRLRFCIVRWGHILTYTHSHGKNCRLMRSHGIVPKTIKNYCKSQLYTTTLVENVLGYEKHNNCLRCHRDKLTGEHHQGRNQVWVMEKWFDFCWNLIHPANFSSSLK